MIWAEIFDSPNAEKKNPANVSVMLWDNTGISVVIVPIK